MSSSMACQRFHSFPEPYLADPLPVIHNSPPITSNLTPQSHRNEPKSMKQAETQRDVNGDSTSSGGWSFQFLANPSQKRKESNETETTQKENVYVHPLTKRSASALSKKSLEMCTESLGSETGSDSGDEFCSLSPPSRRENLPARPKSREFAKKLNFPPPLTSISGSDSVKVRPHRENGRLVIEAVTVSSSGSFFQAERADGRLRLCLVTDAEDDEEEEAEIDELPECEEECCQLDDVAEGVGENNGSIGGETETTEGEYNCDEFDDEEWVEGVGENRGKFGYEIEIGEIHRPSRCYDNGFRSKGIQSWGPVWVAIS